MKKCLSVVWTLPLLFVVFFAGGSKALAGWYEEQNTGVIDVEFYGVSMVDATHGWATGKDVTNLGSTIWKYDGTTWADP